MPGPGNANAARLAGSSAPVQPARQFIAGRIGQMRDHKLAKNVHELAEDRNACIRHRSGETAASIFSAPGSVFGGHHSYPGGLPIHETFNDISDTSFAARGRESRLHPKHPLRRVG